MYCAVALSGRKAHTEQTRRSIFEVETRSPKCAVQIAVVYAKPGHERKFAAEVKCVLGIGTGHRLLFVAYDGQRRGMGCRSVVGKRLSEIVMVEA